MKVGPFNGEETKVFEVKENEQVIGIKACTEVFPTDWEHGRLHVLQFKIGKWI